MFRLFDSPNLKLTIWLVGAEHFQVVLGRAYSGLTGRYLLLRNISVAFSASPYVSFILVLIFDFYVSYEIEIFLANQILN